MGLPKDVAAFAARAEGGPPAAKSRATPAYVGKELVTGRLKPDGLTPIAAEMADANLKERLVMGENPDKVSRRASYDGNWVTTAV